MIDRLDVRRAVETVQSLLRFLVGSAHVTVFRLAWIAILFYGERLTFHNAATRCPWPTPPSTGANETLSTVHVLVVTNPHFIDASSFQNRLFYPLARHVTDNYLKNVWTALAINPNKWMQRGHILTPAQAAQHRTKPKAELVQPPDGVVWMGDLTDEVKQKYTDAEWEALIKRFRNVFWRPREANWLAPLSTISSSRELIVPRASAKAYMPTLFLSGDHDSSLLDVAAESRKNSIADHEMAHLFNGMRIDGANFVVKYRNPFLRFSLNGRVLVSADADQGATHELIMVNGQDLVGMGRQDGGAFDAHHARAGYGNTYRFVESIKEGAFRVPRVLLAHIPLHRPKETNCNDPARSASHGVTRESLRPISQGSGRAAIEQSMVSASVTDWVLQSIDPSVVFSGNDHDHCEYRHPKAASDTAAQFIVEDFEPNQIPELTIKSISMAETVRRPGFTRLSLFSKPNTTASEPYISVAYTPCLLPDQIGIWTRLYLPFLLLTYLGLYAWPRLARKGTATSGYVALDQTRARVDEDEDDPPMASERDAGPISRRRVLGRLCLDLLAVGMVAFPFWIVCQTHLHFLI